MADDRYRRSSARAKFFQRGYPAIPAGGKIAQLPPPDILPQTITDATKRTLFAPADTNARRRSTFDPMNYSDFININFVAGLTDAIALPRATNIRTYFICVNASAAGRLFLTFGTAASVNFGIPIEANLGFYELDNRIPQNDVHIVSDAAGTVAAIVFGEVNPLALYGPAA